MFLKSVTFRFMLLTLCTQLCQVKIAYAGGSSSWADITTSLIAGENHENHRGSAWIDYDNDGFLDLYNSHFGAFDPDGEYLGSANQLLRNIGHGVFVDVTTPELEANTGLSHHPAWADIDNDGLPDLFVTQSPNISGTERSVMLHQDSIGVFSNITDEGLLQGFSPRGIGWQDINNDGLVDLLIAVSAGDSTNLMKNCMLMNEGGGTFVRDALLFADVYKESRSVGWCDYNNDNLPDVYIVNGAEDNCAVIQRTNQLFKNLGEGIWEEVAQDAGVDEIGHGRGCVWGDINNDGYMDLFVGNQKGSDTGGGHNRLFKNNGDGTFSDITITAGVYASERTRCVSMADYNNDGFLDLYIVNFGGQFPPNHLFRNNGDETFTEVASGTPAQGNDWNGASASWTDFDNDGWVDLYIVGGSVDVPGIGMNRLLRNTNQNGNHWIEIELCGTISNRSAIGARISVSHLNASNETVTQMRDIQSGPGYNSQNMLRAHFGLGTSTQIVSMTISWPPVWPRESIIQTVKNVSVDQIIRVVEDDFDFAYDCNRNCINDLVDIEDGSSNDINCNGIPDECEGHVDPCICEGDVNGDGVTNVTDLLLIVAVWGSDDPDADIDGDGTVGVSDVLVVIAGWGDCP